MVVFHYKTAKSKSLALYEWPAGKTSYETFKKLNIDQSDAIVAILGKMCYLLKCLRYESGTYLTQSV